ncbi:amylo-alpha-1,6-glucosidase [Paenibacillus chungangensis]|uniref:Amylo-alpha-1,6-glucosidase n=1 Tax=Paenibacillus chungangensis TaxID=696535 RepID=A0ABW3HKJ7_9BACL
MFQQQWTPFISYPTSYLTVGDAGIGLPNIWVRSNKAGMSLLPGIGMMADVSRDPGFQGWIPHPIAPLRQSEDEPSWVVSSREFRTRDIVSSYKWGEVHVDQQIGVFLNKAVCTMKFAQELPQACELAGHTIGQCLFRQLDNGFAISELHKDLRPMMYRWRIAVWGYRNGSLTRMSPILVSNCSKDTSAAEVYSSSSVTYSVMLPQGTVRADLVLECSRDAFHREEESAPLSEGGGCSNSLQIDEQRQMIQDVYAQRFLVTDGEEAPFYLNQLEGSWELMLKKLPAFQLPDKKLQAYLDFTFVNQLMCELSTEGLLSYPSIMAKQTFWGFWMWDFAFQSVSSRWINGRRVAKGQLLNMLNMQWDNGCITNSAQPFGVGTFLKEHGSDRRILHVSEIPEDALGGSHPPMFGFAVQKMREIEGNDHFIHSVFHALVQYNDWFDTHRRSSIHPDLLAIHKWSDSGQDNSKRWGKQIFTMFGEAEECWWDFPIIPVDVNIFWILQNEVIGKIYADWGETELAQRHLEQAERTKAAIQNYLWNENAGFYFDLHEKSGKSIPVYTPAGFTPLYLELCTVDQYKRLREHLLDEEKFWTRYPLPTLAADDPDFNPSNSYWRGPVWFYFNYFVLEGLFRYDTEVAHAFLRKNVDLFTNKGFVTAFENYNPLTGEGYNAAHFLWGGLLSSTVIERVLGIRAEEGVLVLDGKHVPQEWPSFRVSGIPIFSTMIDVAYRQMEGSGVYTVHNTGENPLKVSVGCETSLLQPNDHILV